MKSDAFWDSLTLETIKFLLNLLVAVTTLSLGWLVGQRLTHNWNIRQKRKELDLSNAKEFQSLYGEFFAVWKLWNYLRKDIGESKLPGASRWELLKRACSAEASMEATFVRLASERNLSEDQIEALGQFRQLYQQLREAIRDDLPLNWNRSEHPDYVNFKKLGVQITHFIMSESQLDVSTEKHEQALKEITSNRREKK